MSFEMFISCTWNSFFLFLLHFFLGNERATSCSIIQLIHNANWNFFDYFFFFDCIFFVFCSVYSQYQTSNWFSPCALFFLSYWVIFYYIVIWNSVIAKQKKGYKVFLLQLVHLLYLYIYMYMITFLVHKSL